MANAKDITPENLSIHALLYGEWGTGKTTFAATFPSPFFLMFDRGGELSLGGLDIEYEPFIWNPLKPKTATVTLDRFLVFMQTVLAKKIDGGEFKTVVLDSITSFRELAFSHVEQASSSKDSRQLYKKEQELVYMVCNALNGWPCNTIVLAHEKEEKDEEGAIIRVNPFLTGQQAAQIPKDFNEVWRTRTVSGNFFVQTKTMGMYKARSRIDGMVVNRGFTGLPQDMEPHYDAFVEYLNGTHKNQKKEKK